MVEQKESVENKIKLKLNDILESAEDKYGKRDYSYDISIGFSDVPPPRLYYPEGNKNIVILLTSDCLYDIKSWVFQLSHEAIHCLAPTWKISATILEEWLATYFSINYTKDNWYGDNWNPTDQKYINAYNLFCKLNDIDNEIIKKLRAIQPIISLITKDDIIKMNSLVPEDLAFDLTQPFYS